MRSRTGPLSRDAKPDRYKIGPLCRWVLPVSELAAWVDRADVGERIAYACGLALAAGAATVLLVRELSAAGLVQSNIVPVPLAGGGREFEWIVTRTRSFALARSQANAGDASAFARSQATAAVLGAKDDSGDAVLRLFRRAAQLGQVAPTNPELARALGLRDGEAARYIVKKLIAGGHIRVENFAPRARRIVTICATGRKTVAGVL